MAKKEQKAPVKKVSQRPAQALVAAPKPLKRMVGYMSREVFKILLAAEAEYQERKKRHGKSADKGE